MLDVLVSYNTAVLLKEKQFNIPTRAYYGNEYTAIYLLYYQGDGSGRISNNTDDFDKIYCEDFVCSAPTQSIAQKWLRENFNIDIVIQKQYINDNSHYTFEVWKDGRNLYKGIGYKTYELALEAAIKISLK